MSTTTTASDIKYNNKPKPTAKTGNAHCCAHSTSTNAKQASAHRPQRQDGHQLQGQTHRHAEAGRPGQVHDRHCRHRKYEKGDID
eukprot:3902309-Prymnesium_polylepis.1